MEVHANVSAVIDACSEIKKAIYPQTEHSKHRTKIEILFLFKARQLPKRVLLQHLDAPLFFLLCLDGHSCSRLLGCLVVQLILPYVLQDTILDMFWLCLLLTMPFLSAAIAVSMYGSIHQSTRLCLAQKDVAAHAMLITDGLQPVIINNKQ